MITQLIKSLKNKLQDKKLGFKWRFRADYPYEAPVLKRHPEKKPKALTPNYYAKWFGTHRTISKKRKK